MKVKNIMSSPVYIIKPDDTVAHARNLMIKHKVGSVLIVDNAVITGIFTKADLKIKLFENEAAWKRRPIDQIPAQSVCTADVVTLSPNAVVADAAKLMIEKKIDHIPIFEKEIDGIVSKTDMIRFAAENLTDASVSDVTFGKAVTVNVSHTLNHIIYEMKRNDVQKVVVMDNNEKAVGIVSVKDLSANYFTENSEQKNSKSSKKSSKAPRFPIDSPFIAEDIMTSITSADVSESIASASKKIIKNDVVSLPVTRNGKIEGMISKDDILKWIAENYDAENE